MKTLLKGQRNDCNNPNPNPAPVPRDYRELAREKLKANTMNAKSIMPDWTMAEADRIFAALEYHRPRGVTYPEAWVELQNRAFEWTPFRDALNAAVAKFIPKARR
jgi:hypothetical protein